MCAAWLFLLLGAPPPFISDNEWTHARRTRSQSLISSWASSRSCRIMGWFGSHSSLTRHSSMSQGIVSRMKAPMGCVRGWLVSGRMNDIYISALSMSQGAERVVVLTRPEALRRPRIRQPEVVEADGAVGVWGCEENVWMSESTSTIPQHHVA